MGPGLPGACLSAMPALLDTDVIIEYLRGRSRAVEFIEGLEEDLLLSAMTVAELFAGLKGADEERALDDFLQAFEVVPITERIARKGGLLRRDFGPRHGTGLADAIVAATAQESKARLFTFNLRHYPMLDLVEAPYKR